MRQRPNLRLGILCGILLCAALGSWAYSWIVAGHSYWVSAAAFSPDGSLLATAAGDAHVAEIILWDVKKFRKVARQKVKSGRPLWIWFSGEGQQVVLACDVVGKSWDDYKPSEITIVDLERGAEVDSFVEPGVLGGTLALDQSRQLATYGRHSIELRGLTDDGVAVEGSTQLVTDHDTEINGFGVSPDERYLAAACVGVARVWDLSTREELPAFEIRDTELDEIAVADGGNFVAATRYELYAAGAETYPLFFWDRAESTSLLNTVHFEQPVTTLRYLPGSTPRLLVVSGKDHVTCRVSLFDPSGQLLEDLYTGNAAVDALDVSRDGTRLVWVDSRFNGELWNIEGPQPSRLWKQTLGDLRSIHFSPDRQLLAGHGWSPEVELFDASTGKTVTTFEGYRPSHLPLYLLNFLPLLLLMVVIRWFAKRGSKHREAAMLIVAKQLGWQRSSGALPEGIPEFHFFTKRRGGRFEHVLLGTGDNYDTLLAIYSWTVGSGEKSTAVQELCVIYPHLRSDLPELFIRPEAFTDKLAEYVGFSDVDLTDSQALERFSGRYLLRTKVPEEMPGLISDSLADFLCEHEGWNIEILDGSVLLWWQRVKSFTSSRFPVSEPAGITGFLDESRTILHLLVPETTKARR